MSPQPTLGGLVGHLSAAGQLPDQWREAFTAVPRELFIPDRIWVHRARGLAPVSRADDPDAWLEQVLGGGYVVTQVDDGEPAGPDGHGRVATSSAARPDIVALMLDAAGVEPGMRVLEIGTGTGYTAALLAHRLGPENVTTVEVDRVLARQARDSLTLAGYGQVTVLTRDGALGHPPGAPYDRVLSTCAAPTVPHQWVAQTRPGGLVVTPWASDYKPAGLLSLTVGSDSTATGGLVDTTITCMPLRAQRAARVHIDDVVRNGDTPDRGETVLHASHVYNGDPPFAIGLAVPGCQRAYVPPTTEGGPWQVWLLDPDTRSWARFDASPAQQLRYPVAQFGPRRLWDEVVAAHDWWCTLGRPPATEWRFTVGPGEQHITAPPAAAALTRRPVGA